MMADGCASVNGRYREGKDKLGQNGLVGNPERLDGRTNHAARKTLRSESRTCWRVWPHLIVGVEDVGRRALLHRPLLRTGAGGVADYHRALQQLLATVDAVSGEQRGRLPPFGAHGPCRGVVYARIHPCSRFSESLSYIVRTNVPRQRADHRPGGGTAGHDHATYGEQGFTYPAVRGPARAWLMGSDGVAGI
jgi:hypothetical protein